MKMLEIKQDGNSIAINPNKIICIVQVGIITRIVIENTDTIEIIKDTENFDKLVSAWHMAINSKDR